MQSPEAPALLLTGVAVALAPLGMALWRLRSKRGLSGFQVSVVAIGLALAALMVVVSATYSFRPLHVLRASNWLVIVPLLIYLASSVALGRRANLEYGSLGIWVAVGTVPLVFFGFYAWLLAACCFGDCL